MDGLDEGVEELLGFKLGADDSDGEREGSLLLDGREEFFEVGTLETDGKSVG